MNSNVPLPIIAMAALFLLMINTSYAFIGPVPRPGLPTSRLLASTETDGASSEYAALSQDEIRTMLDGVPVYAITQANKEGIIMLKEKDNDNDIAYFFFSPQTANAVYEPLKPKSKDFDVLWDVTRFPLGLIWYDLMKNPAESSTSTVVDGVEYRLVPDSGDLAEARNIIEQSIQQGKGPDGQPIPDEFKSPYNEVPVFIDQFLRVVQNDVEKVPMYLGLNDLIATCQQAADATSGEYQASINIASLKSLVRQMQSKSTIDFRQAMMVPPVQKPMSSSDDETGSTASTKPDIKAEALTSDEIELPMAQGDLWDD